MKILSIAADTGSPKNPSVIWGWSHLCIDEYCVNIYDLETL